MMTMTATRIPRLIDHLRKAILTRRIRYDGLVRPFGPGVHREVQLELNFKPRPNVQAR